MRRDGHHKELQHMVIVKSVSWELKEHAMALDIMAYGLLIRAVEHLQEGMMCREAHGEARAEEMPDPVTKNVERALIR